MRPRPAALLALAAVLAGAPAASAAPPKEEPLAAQVRKAITLGVEYLKAQEQDGNWEGGGVRQYVGGQTSLALLALLNCGAKPDDPAVRRGLAYLRTVEPRHTYVVGLQTMVFAEARQREDRARIQRNVRWLLDTRLLEGRRLRGWTYQRGGRGDVGDNSNTQYALLGLLAGKQAGVAVPRDVWESIRDYYTDTQNDNGSWGYAPRQADQRLTMTSAGLCGLLIAGAELGDRKACGVYADHKPVAAALEWIGEHFLLEHPHGVFYNLYGLERAGRLSGHRFFGSHDWYREGCRYLVRRQDQGTGAWQGGRAAWDNLPVISTSFALLFLSKGRTPVLISKLAHGPGDDWNNDRSDARHLTEYASRELFKRQPLAWQVFDPKRVPVRNENDILDLAAELLQSPIAYFNGHKAPAFTDNEKRLLRQYVEQGGFILAEACCGREEFDKGFRELMEDVFPQNPLKELPPTHPIYSAHAEVSAKDYPLYGIDWGCKTVVVYSPKDMSCFWEKNYAKDGRGQLAFRLGGNIVAYATGMELPEDRGTQVEVIKAGPEEAAPPRGYLTVAQLMRKGQRPAKQAVRNLMLHLRVHARLDVALRTEEIDAGHKDLVDYRFLYMHGREDFPAFSDKEVANLRNNLITGGLLFADACCGSKKFDGSFRDLVKRLFPDKRFERIKPGDELYGEEINGEAIELVRCRRERPGGEPDPEFRNVPPYLEGIKVNNRWVVIYSKYDIGCALETPRGKTPAGCLGHDYPSAVKLASAAVFYALKR